VISLSHNCEDKRKKEMTEKGNARSIQIIKGPSKIRHTLKPLKFYSQVIKHGFLLDRMMNRVNQTLIMVLHHKLRIFISLMNAA
jgi:hypothetical protein